MKNNKVRDGNVNLVHNDNNSSRGSGDMDFTKSQLEMNDFSDRFVNERKRKFRSDLQDHFDERNKISTRNLTGAQDRWNKVLTAATGISKWVNYVSKRRVENINDGHRKITKQSKSSFTEKYYERINSILNGIASECDDSSDEEEDLNSQQKQNHFKYLCDLSRSSNKALIIYFSKLARSYCRNDSLDLDFIESLVKNGADINVCDKYGQTVFHEVARIWHCDVAKFLLNLNADINRGDKYGRTPLHIAAAVNYSEMVKFLIQNGADMEAKTYGEYQTPVHYAAKNDAIDSLRMLLKMGCDIEVRDSKQRTPLQVAAELDRSETAFLLVEEGATVGVRDTSGLSAMTLMVEKMPPVARFALDEYHKTDRPNRKQYFYLNLLEPTLPGQNNVTAKTPMQAVIQNKQMNLLLHPVFKRLLQVKWKKFAATKHCINLLLQVLFVLLWSIVGVTTPVKSASEYKKPFVEIWWRVFLESLAMGMTVYFIFQELYEWHCSIRQHKRWREWRQKELEKDLSYCHPRWPEERKYILQELERIQSSNISYFSDWWNVFDWLVYVWIVAGIVPRIISLSNGNEKAAEYHRDILATSLIAIWIRLMKVMRAFQALGPFIVMLAHIMKDTLRFGFLYFEFFIPYIIVFWMLFGGNERGAIMVKSGQSADGWKNVNDLIYSVWLITVVGEYDYSALSSVDKVMAQVLIGTYTALSGILLLNLFIALMSDTFQRVYDNAKANALMQKAISINTHQLNLTIKKADDFRLFIHNHCAPEQLYYDDDDTEETGELQKVTIQIKQVVDEIKEELEQKLPEPRDHRNNNKSDNSDKSREFQEVYKQINEHAQKYEKEIQSLHFKIDHLTTFVTKMVPRAALLPEPKQPYHDESNQHHSSSVKHLPSIYDLKPSMFSEANKID